MKALVRTSILLFLMTAVGYSQSVIPGNWEGTLIAGPQKLKLIIRITTDSAGHKTTLDSPDQGAFGIPLTSTEIKGDSLIVKHKQMALTISALYKAETDSLYSDFEQGGARFKMNWGRSTTEYKFNRPQKPKGPFPYKSEDITFENKNAGNIKLAGTLTIPDNVKNPPAVILISGSGPQDRNEKLLEHEPFLVLADHLSRNGIAVLRYDDRGVGSSEGNFGSATSYDFSLDAEAAFEYLKTRKEVNINNLGIVGHSEGGMIAPMIASRNKDVSFIVLLAGPGVNCDKLLLKQLEDYALAANAPSSEIETMLKMNKIVFDELRESQDNSGLEEKLLDSLRKHNYAEGNEQVLRQFLQSRLSPWFSYFIRFTPSQYLEKVTCPVLALNGDLDKQVNSEMNLSGIEETLKKAGNKDYTVKSLPGLNHLFQEAQTGNESEYMKIEQTFSPSALEIVSGWINEKFNR